MTASEIRGLRSCREQPKGLTVIHGLQHEAAVVCAYSKRALQRRHRGILVWQLDIEVSKTERV